MLSQSLLSDHATERLGTRNLQLRVELADFLGKLTDRNSFESRVLQAVLAPPRAQAVGRCLLVHVLVKAAFNRSRFLHGRPRLIGQRKVRLAACEKLVVQSGN